LALAGGAAERVPYPRRDFAEALAGETVWDSGKVASDANVQIAYAGPALASRQRYWWQVQVWDADGQPSGWSAPGWWEMGLLAPADWRGHGSPGRSAATMTGATSSSTWT
jgi:hypothetical protein